MSSNPNKPSGIKGGSSRQMTSIARDLHYLWIRKSFAKTFGSDLLLALLLFAFSLLQRELAAFGSVQWTMNHYFSGPKLPGREGWEAIRLYILGLQYCVADPDRLILLQVPLYPLLVEILAVLAVIIIFQLIGFIASYMSNEKKIRRKLQPLNEIALRADELRKINLSEDKYQEIEDAIARFQPDQAELLSFGDSELQGIEAAMNNLLLHMRESYKQQARFVNDASHELRTPIAVIQGYVNMLRRWGSEDPQILEESISAISNEADHMKYLVEQLLFLARGDSGRTVLKMEEISLNAMMQELYEESFMIDEEHPYRLKAPQEDILITADAALLKQAARILIDNAAKYTQKGDEIYLSYGRTAENRPYLQIQDTGIGMAENDIAHMFERFYRSDEVRSYQGTGLGLSIAKWIVDKHQGHFEILSRTELGTRIRIVL